MMMTRWECLDQEKEAVIHVTSHQTAISPLQVELHIQSLSTSSLALSEALPAAGTPLPVAPPAAAVTPPGFVAMADPDDAFCNAVYSSLGVQLNLCKQFYIMSSRRSWENDPDDIMVTSLELSQLGLMWKCTSKCYKQGKLC